MHVLFLSRWFPHPADNGSKLRISGLLKELASRHEVSLLSFASRRETQDLDGISELQQVCSRVRAFPVAEFRPASARALSGLISAQPRSFVDTFSQEMSRAVAEEVQARACDVVIASQLDMIPYALQVPGVPLLLEELELSVMQEAISQASSLAQRVHATLGWLKLRAYLGRVLPRFAACTVASDRERANVLRIFPHPERVHIVPNAVQVGSYASSFSSPRANSLVFSGSPTYGANRDAIEFLLKDIMPLIREAEPSVQLRLTGRTEGVDLSQFPRMPGVEWTGYLPDVRPTVAESWASVVPIRVGGGTRLKILEAMALGTPVVATSKGAEGLAVTPGKDILVADQPRAFADAVMALLRSPALRQQMARAARQLVAERYDARAVGQELCRLAERVQAPRAA